MPRRPAPAAGGGGPERQARRGGGAQDQRGEQQRAHARGVAAPNSRSAPGGSCARATADACPVNRSSPLNTNTTFQMLPSVEPIGQGRAPSGVSEAAAIQLRLTARQATSPPASASARCRRSPTSPSSPIAGTAISPWNSFALNARPSTAPAAIAGQTARRCAARTTSQAASTSRSIITESIVSLRAVSTAAGSTASAAAAASPAERPNSRRTRSYSSGTAAMPASASGSRVATGPKPSSRMLATWSHRSSGGLSIAVCPPGSKAPKNRLCHDSDMLRAAAS
jgi:hypothetical protein